MDECVRARIRSFRHKTKNSWDCCRPVDESWSTRPVFFITTVYTLQKRCKRERGLKEVVNLSTVWYNITVCRTCTAQLLRPQARSTACSATVTSYDTRSTPPLLFVFYSLDDLLFVLLLLLFGRFPLPSHLQHSSRFHLPDHPSDHTYL